MLGIDRPVASQPLYNIVNRTAEAEQLPAAAHYGLGVVSYSPLARGVLTGKYRPDAAPAPDTRAGRSDKRILETEWRPESIRIAREIAAHAEARGTTAANFALAWVLNNKLITSAIAGPRTEEQWDGYLSALDYRFTAEDEALVDRLVAPGHTSTHGFTDPGHPVEGRVPRVGAAGEQSPEIVRRHPSEGGKRWISSETGHGRPAKVRPSISPARSASICCSSQPTPRGSPAHM